MSYHPRIESDQYASFTTTRSRNEELWFINNTELDKSILTTLAVATDRYKAEVYAIGIEGNHIHIPATFPQLNRSHFMRDFNSKVAKAVSRLVTEYRGGRFWGRRYSQEFIPAPEDIEEKFFYTVLQTVKDGLVDDIFEYPGYNCFDDAVSGKTIEFEHVDWKAFNAAKKRNKKPVSIQKYTKKIQFSFSRLPGYEQMSQDEYRTLMYEKLKERQDKIVEERLAAGLGFIGRKNLLRMTPGKKPKKSKKSTLLTHRPRVLAICPKRKAEVEAWYFKIIAEYKEASKLYRKCNGKIDIEFPPNTYKPYLHNII